MDNMKKIRIYTCPVCGWSGGEDDVIGLDSGSYEVFENIESCPRCWEEDVEVVFIQYDYEDVEEVSMSTKNVLLQILARRKRQDEKWGAGRTHNTSTWMMILMEELGEAAKAFLSEDIENARYELIDAAAVIVAWIESSYLDTGSNYVKFD